MPTGKRDQIKTKCEEIIELTTPIMFGTETMRFVGLIDRTPASPHG
jgi:hypothetical protein